MIVLKLVPAEPTPEMADLIKRLRIKAGMIELGELIAWGSDSALMREAADVLERLAAPAEQQPAPDVAGLVEALEQVIKAAPSSGPLWHGSEQIVEARAALAAHCKGSES